MKIEYLSQFSKDEVFVKHLVFWTSHHHVFLSIPTIGRDGLNKITQKDFDIESLKTDFGRKIIKESTDILLTVMGQHLLLKSDPEKTKIKAHNPASDFIQNLFNKEKDKKVLLKFMNDRLNLGEFEAFKKWHEAYIKTGGFPK